MSTHVQRIKLTLRHHRLERVRARGVSARPKSAASQRTRSTPTHTLDVGFGAVLFGGGGRHRFILSSYFIGVAHSEKETERKTALETESYTQSRATPVENATHDRCAKTYFIIITII